MSERSDATRLLQRLHDGDAAAADELLPVVYDELHAIAGRHMQGERVGHTLQATALVNEAYLRLVRDESGFEGRHHFFGVASQAMRRVLVDHARRKSAAKRGGAAQRVPLEDAVTMAEERGDDLVQLDEALVRLAATDEQLARIVELRFFGGLTNEGAAEVLDVSSRTIERGWARARAWLSGQLDRA